MRRLKQVVAVFVVAILVAFGAAQFVRPVRAAPSTDPAHAFRAHAGTTTELVGILDRACNDCHSNDVPRGWYARIAPLSWALASGARKGRLAVNFSEWTAYTPEQQRALLAASCADATTGKMPMRPYTTFNPRSKLSARDIATICSAARPATAQTP
jgi:hypothetical protein